MYIRKRDETIIKYLFQAENNMATSNNLAEILNVSARTIKKDIKELNVVLEDYGAEIISMLSKGYKLVINDKVQFEQFINILKITNNNQKQNIPHYRYERINYIIKKMLAIDYYISLDDLADELYVSKSTVAADIKEVKRHLLDYNLKIVGKPKYGVIIEGSEINKRLGIAEFFFHNSVETGFLASDHALFVSQASKQEINSISEILKNTIIKYKINISDASFQNMIIHTVISIRRWKFYNYIKIDKKRQEEIKKYYEYDAGRYYKQQMEKKFNIILPDDEELYFTLHFHCKHLTEIEDINSKTEAVENTINEIDEMLVEKYGLNPAKTGLYHKYLKMHLPVMIERLKTGMTMRNQNSYNTFGKYPLAARITLQLNKIIEKNYHIKNNMDEFAYLVLYVNLLLSEMQKEIEKTKVLLVCLNGRPETVTILNDINEHKMNANIEIDLHDYYTLDNINVNDYSLLVSTMPIRGINVSNCVLKDNLSYYKQIEEAVNIYNLNRINIKRYIDKKYFIGNMTANDRLDVLKKISKLFANNKEVYNSLKAGLNQEIETDKKIVYLNPNITIDEDFVMIIVLKRSIIWLRQWTQIIIWVNSKNMNIRDLYTCYGLLNQILTDKEKVNYLINNGTYESLIKIIKETE